MSTEASLVVRVMASTLVGMTLPKLADQARRLAELGIPAVGGVPPDQPGALLVVHPQLLPASRLATLMAHDGKPGFVVADMTDLDGFDAVVSVPDDPLYLVLDVDRGDDMRNWSPTEALPEIEARGRSPLTISEGISWLLQQPERLEPNHCFMTIGSRKPDDARTPAIWISGGTGRDGAANRGAPKVGWCWAGNRHSWLGFASTARRATL
jgi:hypothetical protein